ncbi:DUF4266 domain-containing protein [Spongiibacter tropicus]|jgi:hypothetical protein|uniref:DUF4266 domain-containing protein n=1 Tax=Spongiibacter tropicus TaxID=454602 RepID=UPI0003B4A2A5|nr:DUF4266 domain-containing protein [Spongiibacter tropicus]MBI58913.1 DUF4266 domain-containing protein [Spongiibacter sp.]|tara:strand:+ start:38798 stop:39019 length:222 start_codon:yes stop_codon:yes gene_type:complete
MRLKAVFTAVLLSGLLAGCATEPVEAWQRGYLARPEMAWDPDPLSSGLRSQIYYSKEASKGGASVGGGGCGCN